MKQHQPKQRPTRVSRWVYLGAFLIPLIIMCAVFFHLKITPFGKNSPLFSDMGAQYIPILENLRTTLTSGQFHLFSYSLGTGSGLIPLMAYYMISPFNLIVLLFSAAKLPMAVTWILILKISTIGLTMAIFLRNAFTRSGWSLLLFSTAFSLCGFVAMYFYDLMWLDALIWLPLVVLGMHRIVSRHHYGLYTVTLTATILSNYYMGYMTCIFSVIYFIYLIIEQQPNETPFKTVCKIHWPAVRQFLIGSILAGGMSMVILIPTAQGMLLTGKSNFFINNYLPTPTFGTEVLAQLGLGGGTYATHLYHAPSLFMGTLMFLLLIVFFVSPKVAAIEKRRAMWVLAIMGLGLLIMLFNTIWHMFQQPAGFPFRNVYFFTFLALVTAYRAWQTHPAQTMNDPQKVLALVWGAGLYAIGYLSAQIIPRIWHYAQPSLNSELYLHSQPAFHLFWVSLGLLLLNTMLLFISEWRPIRIALMGLVIAGELGANFAIATHGMETGSQTKFESDFNRETTILAKIGATKATPNLARVDFLHSDIGQAYQGAYAHYNDPVLFNYAGTSSYSSTLVEQARVFQADLGYLSPNVRRISAQGYTHLSDTLLGLKYRLYATHPESVNKLDTYAGLGFAVGDDFANLQLTDGNPIINQQHILSALGGNAQTLSPAKVVGVKTRRATVEDLDGIPSHTQMPGPRYVQTFTLKATATGMLHAYSPSNTMIYSSLHLNGHSAKPFVNADGSRYMVKLGQHQAGDTIKVSYITLEPAAGYSNQFVSMNEAQYLKLVDKIKQQRLHFTKKSGVSWLSGNVIGSKERPWLYLSIPDTPGWTATVNGQPAKIRSMMHAETTYPLQKNYPGMMGVRLRPGKNHVTFSYQAPGLKTGVLISVVSALIFAGLWLATEWRHPRKSLVKTERKY